MMKRTITFIAAVLTTVFSYAQDVKYHDVLPDTTISTWEVFGVYGLDIWWHPSPEVVVNVWTDYEVLAGTDSMPKALNMGDDISAGSTGIWAKLSYQCLNCGGSIGNWKGVTDKYLAFREKDASGKYYYGWIRLSIPANGTSFTIKDYAKNSIANTALKAGQQFATGITYSVANADITPVVQNKLVSFRGLTQQADVFITDISGKITRKETLKAGGYIDMTAYSPGIYFLRLQTGGLTSGFKIPIE
jgi:hypothetical protein